MKKRVADIIADILIEHAITDVFCVTGGGAMHLNNAIGTNAGLKCCFNHHEQACAMAADGYARYSGRMAAVCVTSGPGGTNALTGVMGAWQDNLPMIVLSGQVRYETTVAHSGLPLRQRGEQEFDILGSVGNMTKYSVMVIDPLSIRFHMEKALYLAMEGRRGPVWLDIPLNVQSSIVEESDLYQSPAEHGKPCIPEQRAVRDVLERLRNAKRPCILAGSAIRSSACMAGFLAVVRKLRLPVVGAAFAADVLYDEHPQYYGASGVIGPRAGNLILQNADVILVLGCRLGYKQTGFAQAEYTPHAYTIMVDIDESEPLKPGINIGQFVHSDLRAFFESVLTEPGSIEASPEWVTYCDNLKAKFSIFNPAYRTEIGGVQAYFLWERYRELEPSDGITVLGNNTGNSSKLQAGVSKPAQRALGSMNCGSMGYDLPAAIGVAQAAGKSVVCSTGDGSIMMNLQELQTIVCNHLPIKILLFNNEGYASIKQTHKSFFNGRLVGCDPSSGLSFPRFERIAESFGFPYHRCASNDEVDESLKWLFAQENRAFLEVMQIPDQAVIPKLMSRMNPDGSFQTPALHDMAPFLEREELESLMLWRS